MYTYPKFGRMAAWGALALAMGWASPAQGQQTGPRGPWQDPAKAIRVAVPSGVPLSVVSADTSKTEIQVRGPIVVIDLRCELDVLNESSQYLRGVTFAIQTEPLAAGGKASVALPSLNVEPGGRFPVSLNLKMLRPLPAPPGELVDIEIDGVLLADFTFFGPDKFNSRRKMTVWEMEADRDRRYFKALLDSGGPQRLQEEIQASLNRQSRRPRLLARPARPSAQAVAESAKPDERRIDLALVNLPGAPLEMVSGTAMVVEGRTASSPRITVKNRSRKPVRYFEVGWLVSDPKGTRYLAASVPASGLQLPPGASASTAQQRQFVFTPKALDASAGHFAISGMSGYLSQVEFDDGSFWIPSRTSLEKSMLIETTPVSAEEQRLTSVYAAKGLNGLIQELSRF